MINLKTQTAAALAAVSGAAPAPDGSPRGSRTERMPGSNASRPAQPLSAARQAVEGSQRVPDAPQPGGPPSGGYIMGSGIGGGFMLGSGN